MLGRLEDFVKWSYRSLSDLPFLALCRGLVAAG